MVPLNLTYLHCLNILSLNFSLTYGTAALCCSVCTHGVNVSNKRAQRALGRSPEEKVKGQGEAIYRGPLMLSTKFW